MIRGSGSGLGRLRIWSVIFFIALAIPSLLLVERAFDQLKWEAFHERQRQAQGLADLHVTFIECLQPMQEEPRDQG